MKSWGAAALVAALSVALGGAGCRGCAERTQVAPVIADAAGPVGAASGDAAESSDAATPPSPPPPREGGRTVLVISIDGLRHDYLRDRAASAPAMVAMARQGAWARTLGTVWPSLTYPAHVTLVTGAWPSRHGVLNNVAFDPLQHNEQHDWIWNARDIKVKTLWDAARAAGIATGSVYWPVTVGADIPWNFPQIWRARTDEDDRLLRSLAPAGVLPDSAPLPAEHRTDRERVDAALAILAKKRPGLLFVYFTDLDTIQHESGPMGTRAATTLGITDGYVKELVAAAKAVSPRVAVALVSDHGFVAVDAEIRPNVLLRREKLIEYGGRGKPERWDAYAWKAGGTAFVMARDPADASMRARVRAIFDDAAKDPKSGIARVYDGEEIARRGGPPGAFVVLEARPGLVFSDAGDGPLVGPTPYRGHHGYAPDMPEMKCSLFFWGDGVARGVDLGDVAMVDVAPTIARLGGFTLDGADGKPLDRALAPAP